MQAPAAPSRGQAGPRVSLRNSPRDEAEFWRTPRTHPRCDLAAADVPALFRENRATPAPGRSCPTRTCWYRPRGPPASTASSSSSHRPPASVTCDVSSQVTVSHNLRIPPVLAREFADFDRDHGHRVGTAAQVGTVHRLTPPSATAVMTGSPAGGSPGPDVAAPSGANRT